MASKESEIYQVIVIGAGIMGSATAFYLSKKYGENVLLLEQFDFLHRRGSSHGDSRIIRRTYPQDHYTFLMKPAYDLWTEAEKEAGFKVYTKTGGLDIGRKDNEALNSLIEASKKHQVPIEILNPSETTKKFPTVHLPEDYHAVYCPESGVLNATKAVSMFQLLARQNGAKLVDTVKIQNINQDDNDDENTNLFTVETTSHGKLRARKIVITSGPWTNKILSQVTKISKSDSEFKIPHLPLTPTQVTVSYFKVDNPDAFDGRQGKFPVFISYEDGLTYGSPCLEFPSLLKCGAHHGISCDPDNRDFQPDQKTIQQEIGPFLKHVFEGVSETPTRTESCIYTITPDSDYILDKIPGVEGLFIGAGFSGHGFKLAPIVGKILSEFVINGESLYPSTQKYFKIDRFQSS